VGERAELDAVTGPAAPERAARHPQHAPEPGPGSRLGKYQIRRQLGAGGMSTVWEARDLELDRRVALKLLSAGDRARMLREARAMAKLRHPNVLTVFDAETLAGHDVIAMELIDGESLATWLGQPRRHEEIVRALLAAGRGLAAAHAAGIVHRDFKPHNVLLEVSGRIVVTDFGLARAAGEVREPASRIVAIAQGPDPQRDRSSTRPCAAASTPADALDAMLTATGAVLGTPAYMAPEQISGGVADARTDQFSFCVALWEALSGQRPFPGETLSEIAAALAIGEPRAPERIPRRLRHVLARGLSHDPAARWPSLDALLAAIERAWARPRRVAMALGTATGLAGLAAAALVAVRGGRPEWRPELVDLPAFEENSNGAAFSPDGTRIAYDSDRDRAGWFRLYVGPVHGNEARPVTPLGDDFLSPRWTRDGKALVAVRWDGATSDYRVVRQPLDGGGPVDLGAGKEVEDCGDALAIVEVDHGVMRIVLRSPDGTRTVLTSSSHEYLMQPRCDPSGQRVLFARGRVNAPNLPGDDVFVIDRQRRELALTRDHASSSGTFTPDGRAVVFSSMRNGRINLYEVAATGGTPRPLTVGGGPDLAAEVSPDGGAVLFDHDVTTRVITTGGDGALRKLTARHDMLTAMVLTADGTWLIAERPGEATTEIVAIATRDGTLRKLADGQQPFLSADRTRVLFVRARELVQMPVDGGVPSHLCDLPATLVTGAAGPDGIHLELQGSDEPQWWHLTGDGRLVREDTAGLVIEAPRGGARIVRTADHAHLRFGDRTVDSESLFPSWLDDHRFAYAWKGAFHIVDAATGAELATAPGPDWGRLAVLAPDGVRWYNLEEPGHVTRHMLINFADRPQSP
jgi:Tol biopolymer transport system component/predicted Ser/Thr protein kinase